MADASKVPFQGGQEILVRSALQQLDDERPACGQQRARTSMRGLGKCHHSDVICLCVTRCRRRHITQDNIGLTAKRLTHLLQTLGRLDVAQDERRTWNRIDLHQVEGDDAAVCPNASHCDLCPATGCSSQINDTCARPQQSVLLIELCEFVRGPASEPSGLGFGHIGIVNLPR